MPTPGEITLPPKKFLRKEQLLEVWEGRGLRFRVDEIHKHLRDHGLFPVINRVSFRNMMITLLEDFLIDGDFRRDPKEVHPNTFVKSDND